MSNIYFLNQTPHSFWDVIADVGDQHGFPGFGHPPPYASGEGGNGPTPPGQEQAGGQTDAPQPAAQAGQSAQQDHPEPATRGLGENSKEKGPENPPHDLPFRGRGCRPRHGGGCGGPGAFRGSHFGRGCGPDARFRRHHSFGPGAHPWWGRRRFAFDNPGSHNESRAGPGAAPFDIPAFLQNLGSQLGINLGEVLNSVRSTDHQVDFTPRADIFDTPTHFLVHVSLPGAQRPDLSVDYDTDNSTLRLAGVVYRPGVDETLNAALVLDGRGREVGVFQRDVRLGTRTNPVNVDANRISAKLTDGVLVVVLPKAAANEEAGRKTVSVEQVTEDKDKEKEKEKEADAMHLDSETEAGDDVMGQQGNNHDAPHHPSVEDEDEETEYVTVDVD